jgi:hypothetical protein
MAVVNTAPAVVPVHTRSWLMAQAAAVMLPVLAVTPLCFSVYVFSGGQINLEMSVRVVLFLTVVLAGVWQFRWRRDGRLLGATLAGLLLGAGLALAVELALPDETPAAVAYHMSWTRIPALWLPCLGLGAALGQAWVLRRRGRRVGDWPAFNFLCLLSWTLCLPLGLLLVHLLNWTATFAALYWFVLMMRALS